MKKVILIAKITFFIGVWIILLAFFWPFVIPGVLLAFVFRGRHHLVISLAVSLLVISINLVIRDGFHHLWIEVSKSNYTELSSFVITWLIGTVVVGAAYSAPSMFLKGFHSKTRQEIQD